MLRISFVINGIEPSFLSPKTLQTVFPIFIYTHHYKNKEGHAYVLANTLVALETEETKWDRIKVAAFFEKYSASSGNKIQNTW